MQISDVDCECEFQADENEAGADTEVLMSAVDQVEIEVTPQLVVSITEADENQLEVLSPDTTARARRRPKKKMKHPPRLNVVREKSPFGTNWMNVDVDINAGEVTASTDGIIEMEPIEYAESESSITIEEDFMDVDVAVRDIDDFREDSIEAILPKSPIRERATQLIILKAHEEVELQIKQEVPAAQPEPVPEVPEKKVKKKKPEALNIPDEIKSLNGEPSTLVSTANLTQELAVGDKNQAEIKAVSPVSYFIIIKKLFKMKS